VISESNAARGALAGVRVLDLTSVVMGPLATQILGDLGADVILVEGARLDTNRVMGQGPHPMLSGIALNLLRNKRSICVDLKHPKGRAVFLRIAESCDVLVTNLRPGPLRRLRLEYADVAAVRPDIVYCQAQGFASDGPRADEPAYDDIIQAASGVADATFRATGSRALAPTLLADKVCGLTIAYSVIAALFDRTRTRKGQHIEVPMLDTVTAFMLTEHGSAAISRPRQGRAGYPRILTPFRRPQRTSDGWISVLPYSRRHYDELFNKGGRVDLLGDERIASGRARIANSDFLYEVVAGIMPMQTTAEWLAFCRDRMIPASAVADLDDLVDALPDATHPLVGDYKLVPPPVRFSRTPSEVRRSAPLPGQHNHEVLRDVGLSDEDIGDLEEAGILGHGPASRSG
jgi:crotonobetainyl-CoA:carnitine CoA-transferase CaiB-like acyl-CoA transferase